MNEADMYGVVHTIIDTHRDAAIRRRKRFQVAAVALAVIVASGYLNTVSAEPAPAYVGCTLAWDYPEEQAHLVQSFGVHIDDRPGSVAVNGQARSIPCATLNLTLGKTHLLKARAWNKQLGHSPFAEITVAYQPKPEMVSPTNIRVQLEWVPQ